MNIGHAEPGAGRISRSLEQSAVLLCYGLAGFIAIGAGAATLWWLPQHLFASPIYDGIFDKLRFYQAWPDWRTLLAYLVSPHNEHRILTTRLFAVADEIFFSGREITLVVATTILQILSAGAVFVLIRRWVGRNWTIPESLFALGTSLLLFVNSNFLYTLLVPFQLQHTIMAVLGLIASAALAHASADGRVGKSWLLVGLVLIAVVATFTLGNAPAILLTATLVAAMLRWRLRIVVAIAVLAALHVAWVVATTAPVGARSFDLAAIVKFLLIYLGAPFLRLTAWPAPYATFAIHPYLAAAFGAVIFATGTAFAVLRLLRPGLGGKLGVFGFALLAIVIATGLAAALSRAQFGILEGANKKYASFAALGWVGAASIAAGVTHQLFAQFRASALWPLLLVYLLVLPMTISAHFREPRIWAKFTARNWEAASAMLAHLDARGPAGDLYTDNDRLREYVAFIEPRRRGLFAQYPVQWGENGASFLGTRRETPCRGEVETTNPIPAQDRVGIFRSEGVQLSVSGWTWMEEDHAPARFVIALDTKQQVAGIVATTRASARAEEWLGQKFDQDLGWFGYARLKEPGPIAFVALSRDGNSYCVLGSPGSTR
jgi:hypothetical protein